MDILDHFDTMTQKNGSPRGSPLVPQIALTEVPEKTLDLRQFFIVPADSDIMSDEARIADVAVDLLDSKTAAANGATKFLLGKNKIVIYGYPIAMVARSVIIADIEDIDSLARTPLHLAPTQDITPSDMRAFIPVWLSLNGITASPPLGGDIVWAHGLNLLDKVAVVKWLIYFDMDRESEAVNLFVSDIAWKAKERADFAESFTPEEAGALAQLTGTMVRLLVNDGLDIAFNSLRYLVPLVGITEDEKAMLTRAFKQLVLRCYTSPTPDCASDLKQYADVLGLRLPPETDARMRGGRDMLMDGLKAGELTPRELALVQNIDQITPYFGNPNIRVISSSSIPGMVPAIERKEIKQITLTPPAITSKPRESFPTAIQEMEQSMPSGAGQTIQSLGQTISRQLGGLGLS